MKKVGGRGFVGGLYQALFSFRLACPNVIYKVKDRGAFFKVRGPVTISFVVGGRREEGGRGANLAILSLWLFRTVRQH